MRIEINLPNDKYFLDKLQMLADAENRSRKNFLETVIINLVNKTVVNNQNSIDTITKKNTEK